MGWLYTCNLFSTQATRYQDRFSVLSPRILRDANVGLPAVAPWPSSGEVGQKSTGTVTFPGIVTGLVIADGPYVF